MAEGETNDSNIQNEETLTLSEVIKMEEDLQDDVYAVLGASNDKNCSYIDGYIKRQALYACLTCTPEAKEDASRRAGICLACSYHCHDGHDLVELFTKRNFRCDCGNAKFGEKKCNLCPIKDEYNDNNIYNQNFSGVYCTCSRPYPDPEDVVQDEMIQCIVCEDWYHTRHLDAKVPENYAEMICGDCVRNHSFILNYEGLTVTKVIPSNENLNFDVVNSPSTEVTTEASDASNVSELPVNNCKKPKLSYEPATCAKFFVDETWRQQLCMCKECLEIYENEKITYIMDPQDTVQSYEVKGNAKAVEQQKEMENKFLSELPRVPLLETMAAYDDLKKNLGEFLKSFAENNKVVRVEDVKEFFAEMQAKKKPKLDYQYYCS